MGKPHRKSFPEKYRALFLVIAIIFCINGYGQTYQPSSHIVANDAIGFSQATPSDSRSMFYDVNNFVYRDYNGTTEVLSYLNLAKYRFGHFPLYVHSGGSLSGGVWTGGTSQIWWFKNGTADSNLVRWYTDSTGGTSGSFLIANNLSEGNPSIIRSNIGLGSMATLNSTAGGDLSGIWPNITTQRFNGQLPSYYLNYSNLTNTPTPLALTTIGTSGIATYSSGTGILNIPNYTGGSGGACLNCNADTIAHLFLDASNTRNGYVITLDSINGKFILAPVPGGTGSGITTLNGLTSATQSFATGTSGTDFNINSSGSVHTFNFPSSSAVNRGLLTSADWSSFAAKLSTAANGLTDSLHTAILGGVLYKNTTIDLATYSRFLWLKTPLKTTTDTAFTGQIIIGDTNYIPYVPVGFNDQRNASLVIDKTKNNNNGNVDWLAMTTGDAGKVNGFLFRGFSQVNGRTEPQLHVYNADTVNDNGNPAFTTYAYRKQPSGAGRNFGFTLNLENYDSLMAGVVLGKVRGVNPFVVDNGSENVFFIDSFYNVKLGPSPFFTAPRARLDIRNNSTTTWGVFQEGTLAKNVLQSSLTIGGAFPATDTLNKFTVIGTAKITDTFKLPNAVLRSLDTTNFKLAVLDASGNAFKMSWAVFAGGGTVSSVALSLPAMFNVTGSPVTTTGTLTAALANQSANTAFGNFTGSSAAPTFGKVPIAAFATSTANTLIGFDGSGNPVNITAGTNVTISGGSISATGGGGGSDSGIIAGYGIGVTRAGPSSRTVRVDTSSTGLNNFYVKSINTDVGRLPQIKAKAAFTGVTASGTTVTNYPATSVDSVVHYWGVTNIGTDYGGVLWSGSTGGDSLYLANGWWGAIIGNSIAEGHISHHGLLHPNGVGIYTYNYPDSAGQLSFELRAQTNHRWRNIGIGGQTLKQIRARWGRDVLGQVTPNATDGRGSQTTTRKPNIIIVEGGINDVYAGRTAEQILADYEWMAMSAQESGIYFVAFNLPGDATATQPFLTVIATVNGALQKRLEKYGGAVYDFNSWWNDPAYGNDNIHHNANISDDIHPTPTGYTLIAPLLAAAVNLPKIVGIVFQNEIGPGGFSGYSRPNGITISGVAGTITKSTDTLSTPYFLNDSLWIKTTSTTNVSGTTFYGYSSVYALVDNNPSNLPYYTRKVFPGAVNANLNVSSLKMIAENANNNVPILQVQSNDTLLTLFKILSSAGGATAYINTATQINGGTLNVGGIIATSASVIAASGTASQFNNLQVGNTSAPGTTGFGVGIVTSAVDFQSGSSPSIANEIFRFNKWNTFTPNITSNAVNFGLIKSTTGFGTNSDNDTVSFINWQPTINNTAVGKLAGFYGGIYMRPTLTALGASQQLFGFWNTHGNNYFNSTNGKTAVGTSTPKGSGRFEIFSVTRGFLPPRMTTGQRDSIGYIATVTITNAGSGYTTAPVATVTGAGAGAVLNPVLTGATVGSIGITEPGEGYKVSIGATVSFSGGGGTGAAATLTVNGADSGLVIYNRTTEKLEVYDGHGTWTSLGSGGGGATNIGSTQNATSYSITSSTGTGTTLATATASLAGLLDTARAKFVDSLKNGTKTFNIFAANGLTVTGGNTFNLGGTLNQNTIIDGGASNFNFSIGNGIGNYAGSISLNANTLISLNAALGTISELGLKNITGYSTTNLSISTSIISGTNSEYIKLDTITANRTIPIPAASISTAGYTYQISNYNNSAFSWTFTGATVTDLSGNTYTTIPNGATIRLYSTQYKWYVLEESQVNAIVESSGSTLTLANNSDYVFNGTTTTWTLPSLALNQRRRYYIKNAGSGSITLSRSGSDNIYDTGSATTITIAAGTARIVVGGPSFWYIE